jgi:hypothetical protein
MESNGDKKTVINVDFQGEYDDYITTKCNYCEIFHKIVLYLYYILHIIKILYLFYINDINNGVLHIILLLFFLYHNNK